jgi:hypothetical protein
MSPLSTLPPPPALSADTLIAVLRALNGDVASLCAAACVSRAWRDAALHPSLWRDFSACFGDGDVAARLTDARLAALVTRARGGLERLHLSSCTALTAFGVVAALRGCPPLTTLRVRALQCTLGFCSKRRARQHGSTAARQHGSNANICGRCCENGVRQAMRLERTRRGCNGAKATAAQDEQAPVANCVPCDMARMCRTMFCAACAPTGLSTAVATAAAVVEFGFTPHVPMQLCAPCACGDTDKTLEAQRQQYASERASKAGAAGPSGVAA